MPVFPSVRRLNGFFLASWLIAIAQLARFQDARQFSDFATGAWTIAATLSYAFIYLLPALLIGHLLRHLLAARGKQVRGAGLLLAAVSTGLVALTQVLLFADHLIHDMYGFHINGFVIDLISTPGGIASLGASTSTQVTAAAIVAGLIALQFAVYAWALRSRRGEWLGGVRWRWLLPALVVMSAGERIAYGYSHVKNFEPILFASERTPLYLPMTFRKVAARLGIEPGDTAAQNLDSGSGLLNYPIAPLVIEPPEQPLNVVWLVAESLRFDMLDPAIMPGLWALSNDALRLENHYSGGNMTQMGVFSMFYGLYGNYWFPMRAAQQAPVLMDVLQQQGYQFRLNTSQRFTYPAFDKTIFAKMRPEDMHALDGGAPAWQRDVRNIDDLIDFIDRRDRSRPFMTYMFFESTHANYDYPPGSEIATPVLEDFNYITADFAGQIDLIKNRYLNAAHHVDAQITRLVEHLRDTGLLERTVVIVLGDHGEEFMERTRWGHSAEFNRFQTCTPAVIRVPGHAPRVIESITSHLDIPATLMPLLGVRNPPEDYSLGHDLLAPGFHRDYAVAADWNRIAYIGTDFKVTFPVNVAGALRNEVTDGDDRPVAGSADVVDAIRPAVVEIMKNLTRFSRHQN